MAPNGHFHVRITGIQTGYQIIANISNKKYTSSTEYKQDKNAIRCTVSHVLHLHRLSLLDTECWTIEAAQFHSSHCHFDHPSSHAVTIPRMA